jgi:hypothetical protein
LFGAFGDLYVGSVGTNSILHFNGDTGGFINALVTRHDDQTLSGPRGLFFSETSPTTLNYRSRHRPGPGASGGPPPADGHTGLAAESLAVTGGVSAAVGLAPASGTAGVPVLPALSTLAGADVSGSLLAAVTGLDSARPQPAIAWHVRDALFAGTEASASLPDLLARGGDLDGVLSS